MIPFRSAGSHRSFGRFMLGSGLLVASQLVAVQTLAVTAAHAEAEAPAFPALLDITRQLEYLGYEVSMPSASILKAVHPVRSNFTARQYQNGLLLSVTFLPNIAASNDPVGYLRLVNKLNQDATAARFYVNDENSMIVEGWYPYPYNRTSFARFMDGFNQFGSQFAEGEMEITRYLK